MSSNPVSILDDPAVVAARVVTVEEAKIILKVKQTKLYDLLNSKAIRSYRDGRDRRIYLSSILEWQAAQQTNLGLGLSPNPKARHDPSRPPSPDTDGSGGGSGRDRHWAGADRPLSLPGRIFPGGEYSRRRQCQSGLSRGNGP
jgi:excisionase family DNA binding protein